MIASVMIVDEHFGTSAPARSPAGELRLASKRVTPREIIRQRVEAEVEELNRANIAHLENLARTRFFLVTVEAGSPEALLNGPVTGKRRPKLFDLEQEIQRAQAAFDNRSFIMLFDDRQVDDPDEWVTLMSESEIAFIYLMPLRGG